MNNMIKKFEDGPIDNIDEEELILPEEDEGVSGITVKSSKLTKKSIHRS